MVIDRGAFLSGRYARVYDEIVQVKEACRRRPPQGDPGDRRAGHVRQRPPGLARWRWPPAPTSSRPRPARSRPPRRSPVTLCMLEAIRDLHDDTGRAVGMKPAGGIRPPSRRSSISAAPRDARRRVADPRAVPVRRLLAAQRRAHADPHAAHRRLPVPRLLHDRLMGEHRAAPRRRPRSASTPPRPSRARSSRFRERYGLFIGGEDRRAALGRVLRPRSRRRPRSRSQRWPRPARRTSTRPSRPPARRSPTAGRDLRRRERAKYLFRIARILQERARELAVARVAGRRQADQGVARRRPAAGGGALLLPRRLGRQAGVRVPRPAAAAARRRRARSSPGTSRC